VLTTCIVFGNGLREIAHGGGKLALRAAKLLQHQIGETGVRGCHADGILQAFIMYEHINGSLCGRTVPCGDSRAMSFAEASYLAATGRSVMTSLAVIVLRALAQKHRAGVMRPQESRVVD